MTTHLHAPVMARITRKTPTYRRWKGRGKSGTRDVTHALVKVGFPAFRQNVSNFHHILCIFHALMDPRGSLEPRLTSRSRLFAIGRRTIPFASAGFSSTKSDSRNLHQRSWICKSSGNDDATLINRRELGKALPLVLSTAWLCAPVSLTAC